MTIEKLTEVVFQVFSFLSSKKITIKRTNHDDKVIDGFLMELMNPYVNVDELKRYLLWSLEYLKMTLMTKPEVEFRKLFSINLYNYYLTASAGMQYRLDCLLEELKIFLAAKNYKPIDNTAYYTEQQKFGFNKKIGFHRCQTNGYYRFPSENCKKCRFRNKCGPQSKAGNPQKQNELVK